MPLSYGLSYLSLPICCALASWCLERGEQVAFGLRTLAREQECEEVYCLLTFEVCESIWWSAVMLIGIRTDR